jgi:hypothetical protein
MPRSVQPGNHIKVGRGLYDHHGIYMGVRGGVHVVAELAKPGEGGMVRFVSWDTFSRGAMVQIVDHPNGLPLAAVVANVLRTPRWRKYDLLDWNCEHFATWCSTHQATSSQVDGIAKVSVAAILLVFLAQLAA